MFERMLDKSTEPSLEEIRAYLGEEGFARLCALEEMLSQEYDLSKALRFPFGNKYGWGYKYSHKAIHLCYAFFEQGAFTVMIQVGDGRVSVMEELLPDLTPKAKELWASRYPCGDRGGWVNDRVLCEEDLADVLRFVHAKKEPPQKK